MASSHLREIDQILLLRRVTISAMQAKTIISAGTEVGSREMIYEVSSRAVPPDSGEIARRDSEKRYRTVSFFFYFVNIYIIVSVIIQLSGYLPQNCKIVSILEDAFHFRASQS